MAKYQPFKGVPIVNREWPDKVIGEAPVWCSVDLRDGNQALARPMGIDAKLEMFDLLLRIGFKEIEVGFPSASQIEFDFIRRLIEEDRIPEDVSIQILCQTREHLIDRSIESLVGARNIIFHLYTSTSPNHREYTFGSSREEITEIAVRGTEYLRSQLPKLPGSRVTYQFSPESFSNTEIDYALDICRSVTEAWAPDADRPMILNLPATVEICTPNQHADQIEYFRKQFPYSDDVLFSLHTHNDRGTAVAAAEMGLLAGAGRVEGTLFGNGERTGNLDLVTLALNMTSQGIETGLDFSFMPEIAEGFVRLTGMEIPPRQPYAGDLVFTAFSGSHQDAIRKALAARSQKEPDALWDVTYLPLDPKDLNRSYEALIRINSQSGKGGVSYILEQEYGIEMPKAMHPEFGRIVNDKADELGDEMDSEQLYRLFEETYLSFRPVLDLGTLEQGYTPDGRESLKAEILLNGEKQTLESEGSGPIDAFMQGLIQVGLERIQLLDFHEHAVGQGSSAEAYAYVKLADGDGRTVWGCGRNDNIARAGILAVVSAVNRLVK